MAANRVVDLNARRAARAEKQGDPPEVRLGDDVFVLRREVPLNFAELAGANRLRDCCALIVGEDRVDQFLAHGISGEDLEDILREAYGQEPGESPASTDS